MQGMYMKQKILMFGFLIVFCVNVQGNDFEYAELNDQMHQVDSSLQLPSAADNYYIDMDADEEEEEREYTFNVWGVGYSRSADKAFSCNGKWKVPLSTLVFGKSCFTLSEAFAGSQVTVSENPWVSVSKIQPRIEYYEKGGHVGLEYAHDVEFRRKKVRIGARAYLPIRSIRMARRYSGADAESEVDSIDDVRKLTNESITDGTEESVVDNSFAYRMDFLSNLLVVQNDSSSLLVDYDSVPLRMNDAVVAKSTDAPVSFIKRSDSTVPSLPFAAVNTTVNSLPLISADGTGISNDQRGRLNPSTDYSQLSASPTNQSQLWMVSTVSWNGSEFEMLPVANALRSEIESIISGQIDSSVIDYLISHNINLGTQEMTGLGDLSTQLFMQWTWPNTEWWTELNCEFIFPTGKKCENPLNVFCYPLGNNGHVDIGPGVDIGWQMLRWLSLNADFGYHFVLRGYENVAAPFCGACIKNIGPCIRANISWQYLKLFLDVNIVEPRSHQFGVNAGYELYFKQRDSVSIPYTYANDFGGDQQLLNPNSLSYLTRQIGHKLRAEFFFNTLYGSIFGGFSYLVAGENIPNENSWYAGLLIEF